MNAPEEPAFLRLLSRIEKDKYTPNLGERAVICRTFNSRFNPIGIYFSFIGAVSGFLATFYARRPSRRVLGALIGSIYSFEISWTFQDHHPCLNFFNDIQSINGELREKASNFKISDYLNHKQQSFFWIIFNFLTFNKTWKWMYLTLPTSVYREQWLQNIKMEWFDDLPLDPLTMWYWRLTLSQNTLK